MLRLPSCQIYQEQGNYWDLPGRAVVNADDNVRSSPFSLLAGYQMCFWMPCALASS